MGVLDEIARQIMGADTQKLIAAENPYYSFMKVPAAFATGALAADSKNSNELWQRSGAASLGAALGGVLEGFGNDYQQTLTDRYRQGVDAAIGGDANNVVGLPPNLFRAAQDQAALFKALQAQEAIDLQQEVAKAGLLEQEKLLAQDAFWRASAGVGKKEAAEGPPVIVPAGAAPAAAAAEPLGNPNNPYYQEQTRLKERTQDLTEKIRKEFSGLPEVKNFSIVERSARVIAQAVKDPSSVSDQELVRYSILLIEPGMAVREGEQRAIAMSQSIPATMKGWLSKALTGQTALQPQMRAGLLRLAQRAYEGQAIPYQRALDFYRKQAESIGISPEAVSYIGDAPSTATVMGAGQGDIAARIAADKAAGVPREEVIRRYANR